MTNREQKIWYEVFFDPMASVGEFESEEKAMAYVKKLQIAGHKEICVRRYMRQTIFYYDADDCTKG